jgi:septin family protein
VVKTPDGREVRGRAYPWGVVEVDNEDHCDFVKLRQMLVRTYMEELREYTNDVLYENWRTEKLVSMGVVQDQSVFKEIKYVTFLLSPGDRLHCPSLAPQAVCKKSVSCTRPSLRRWRQR